MRQRRQIGPFLGAQTALDARHISDMAASDLQNVTIEDGAISVRKGYRAIASAQNNFASLHGFDYAVGFNSSNTEVEEYLSFERLSTDTADKCKPYRRIVTHGAPTVITDGGTPLSLDATGEWRMMPWQDAVYCTNPSDNKVIYKHVIGNTSSFADLAAPSAPTTNLQYSVTYPSSNGTYSQANYAGNTFALAGLCTSRTVLGPGSVVVYHTAPGSNMAASWEYTHSADKDWYYNDIFGFTAFSTYMNIDVNSIRITFINNAGTPVSIQPTVVQRKHYVSYGDAFSIGIWFRFDDKTRSDWGDGAGTGKIRKFKVEYTVTSSTGNLNNNWINFSPLDVGGMANLIRSEGTNIETYLQFAYSYRNASAFGGSGAESVKGGALMVPQSVLQGTPTMQDLPGLGVLLSLTATTTAESGVDNWTLYVRDRDDTTPNPKLVWRKVGDYAIGSLTQTYRHDWKSRHNLALESARPAFAFSGCKFGVPFSGWAVWFYKGGYRNVRHSWIGLPERLASDLDPDTEESRGATFSLADNFADEAENAFQADNSLIILGKYGVYAQQGTAPWNMTPPKRLPGSQGVANPFACARWKDDSGGAGVVFVDRNAEGIWFARVETTSDERGMRVVQLDEAIRGKVKEYLIDGQSALSITSSQIRVFVDETLDTLWVMAGKRALVLRRPSLVDGRRQWEFYEYTFTSTEYPKYISSSKKRRMRWMTTDGKFQELEYNSNSGVYITGTNRDGGNAVANSYWTSKIFTGDNSRVDAVYVERDDYTDTPTVTCTSSRQTASKTLTSGKRWTRFDALQQGWEHKFTITIAEGSDPIRRLTFDQLIPNSRRVKS